MRTLRMAAAAGSLLLLVGCGTSEPGTGDPGATSDSGTFPVTVDGTTVDAEPERIVSLSPAVTEMLFAIDAGSQVVAVDEYSNYPADAPITDLSGFSPNIEAIASYDPDLVIVSAFGDEIVPQLGTLGITAFVAPDDPRTIDAVYDQITDLGTLTGNSPDAEDLVERMRADIGKLVADSPEREQPLTYYIEIDDTYWTYTAGSLVGSLLEELGLRNIADDEATVSTQLSAEAIVAADPDVIFLMNSGFGVDAETVSERPGWGTITAVREGTIFPLDADIAARWGPRTVDLVAEVARATDTIQ
ncbi:ABC transporter substrate-binding protein [Hoyosella sp. G463]|uniref:ABC transporter substrate-binding protein n=1 Tax=Lolliginicoccus lacisalsi TaxID=2742202 RepID=A0A927PKY1_9ACTN|nr:ABC transporter substrate-binding protein [Lolliginicoccus lacisalsi]MBD8506193.1 ABC transporter substrate-binding protein [Lolliginicoccus lacisalsi]